MRSLNDFLLHSIEKRNGIDFSNGMSKIGQEVASKKNEIESFIASEKEDPNVEILYKKFIEYSLLTEKLILTRRLESGASTLLFFIYTILGDIAGIVMSLLAFLTTTGLTGHLILIISMIGGIVGLIVALNSIKRERSFVLSLKSGY
ncbi:MAG: hypothetical protein M1515_01450 [Candidatus Thermoplasmatota archaeon]|nr:hypothetical protein [Candidatus Thermoplasmatota archaeon]